MSIKQEPDTVTEDLTELEPDYSDRDVVNKNKESSAQVKIECDIQEEDSAVPNTTLLQRQGFESADPTGRNQVRTLNDSSYREGYFDNINVLQGRETSAMDRCMQYTDNDITDTPSEDEGVLLQDQGKFHRNSSQMVVKSEVNTPMDSSLDSDIQVLEDVKDFQQYLPTSDDVLPNQQDQVKVYKCGTCPYSSNLLFDLYQHNTSNHTNQLHHSPGLKNRYKCKTQYFCDLCGYRCVQDKAILHHITRHLSGKRYSCDLCEYACDFPFHMKQHYRKHTGEKPYSCELCDYTCSHHSSLAQHRKIHTGEKSYSDDCNVSGSQKSNVGRKPNIGRTKYSCDFCEYTSEKPCEVKRHRRKHTGEKPYSCSVCNFTCALPCSLAEHRRIHTGEKPYSCDVCDFSCIKSTHLTQHKRTHTGEKPYSCDVCNYTCARSSYLNVHKRKHTGEKPYSCDLCDYTCTRSTYLKKHKLITHTGEKPYSCDVCDFTCARSSHLNVHKRTHTGEKIYSCDLCDYNSIRVSDLNKHKRNHRASDEKPVVQTISVKEEAEDPDIVSI